VIRSKIEIKGRSIAVYKVDKNETISTLLEGQVGRGRGKTRKTYHASGSKDKSEDKNVVLKNLLCALIVSKQKFETELLRAKIKLEEFKKFRTKEKK